MKKTYSFYKSKEEKKEDTKPEPYDDIPVVEEVEDEQECKP